MRNALPETEKFGPWKTMKSSTKGVSSASMMVWEGNRTLQQAVLGPEQVVSIGFWVCSGHFETSHRLKPPPTHSPPLSLRRLTELIHRRTHTRTNDPTERSSSWNATSISVAMSSERGNAKHHLMRPRTHTEHTRRGCRFHTIPGHRQSCSMPRISTGRSFSWSSEKVEGEEGEMRN